MSSDLLTERSEPEVEGVRVVGPGEAGGGDPLEVVLSLHPFPVLLILPPVRDTEGASVRQRQDSEGQLTRE